MPGRFKTVYLHIGLGKTGSSSIQRYLHTHRAWLAQQHDIHYPDFSAADGDYTGNHSPFIRLLFGSTVESDLIHTMARHRTDATRLKYRQRIESTLNSGIDEQHCSTLLISAEGVGHLCTPTLRRIHAWLAGLSNDVRVLACVRHPRDALASEIQQRLKTGETLEQLYEALPYYAFKPFFSRFEKVFGEENLRLYDFADAKARRGSLEAAFLQQLGIHDNLPAGTGEVHNPGMSVRAALYLSALNRLEPIVVNGLRNPKRSNAFLHYVQNLPGEKYQLPCNMAARVHMLAEPDLAWLRENHGLVPRQLSTQCDDTDYRPRQHEIDGEALRLIRRFRYREKLLHAWLTLKGDRRGRNY